MSKRSDRLNPFQLGYQEALADVFDALEEGGEATARQLIGRSAHSSYATRYAPDRDREKETS